MEKIDLTKVYPEYYKANGTPRSVDLKPVSALTISGVCAPEDELFLNSIETIYPVAYTVKKYCKQDGNDFKVAKMEGFWWVESDKPFDETPRSEWYWKIVIPMPEFVTNDHVDQAVQEVIQKKDLALANEVTLELIEEGKSVQALHHGSYEEEAPTISKIMGFMEQNNLRLNGKHHEIYLSDPRKTSVEKLKTIIRYAVK